MRPLFYSKKWGELMAYDGSLIFDTKINREGFEKGVKQLGTISGKAFGAITKSVMTVGTALTVIGGASAKVGMDFESNMSQVAATMGITVDEINKGSKSFELLKEAAKEAGRTTKFSASESSEALNYLALAGYDAEKSVEALPKVLNLAAAGSLDLGYASDLVTDSMSALGLEMNELEGFTDELAKTSQKSNTNISQLGEAILTVGGTAKTLAGGTVELSTALGILADNGIKGAEGGTALRNMILSLSAPTDKAASKIKDLGLEVFDAEGNMRPLNEVFQDLDRSLEGMTEGEKTQVLNTIFNKVDLKSANALLANSGERFDELSNEIANADGAAAEMAETLNNNLKGKVGLLGSALEGLGIEIYENIDTPFNSVIDTLNGYVTKLTEVLTTNDKTKEKLKELGVTAIDLGVEIEDIPSGFEGMVTVLGEILADMITKIAESTPKILDASVKMIKAFIKGIKDNKINISNAAIDITTMLLETFFDLIPELLDLGVDLILAFIDGMENKVPTLIGSALQMTKSVLDTFFELIPEILDLGIGVVLSLIEGMIDTLPELIDGVLEIVDTILNKIIENLPLIIEMGITIIIHLIEGLLKAIPKLILAIPEIISAIIDTLLNYDWINDGSQIVLMLIEGLLAVISAVGEATILIGLAILDGIWEGIGNIVEIGKDIARGLWEGIKSMKGWIGDKVKSFGKGIADSFKGFFGIRSPSTLMKEFGINIVEGLAIGIKENKTKAEKAMYDMAQSIVKEYDRLGDAVISALKARYREEEQAQKDSLKFQTDTLKSETNKRIAIYNEEFKAKLKTLTDETSKELKEKQDQIDAINNKTKEENKELKEQEYNNKISLKEKEILEAKSNEERLKLQAELNAMKAEREREHLLEQREMQIEALRQEMDNIQTQAKEKQDALDDEYKAKIGHQENILKSLDLHLRDETKALENHYATLLEEENLQAEARRLILDENNTELIELLDSYNPYWQNAGQSFGESLLIGLNSMKKSIEAEVAEILSLISEVDRQNANLANQNEIIIQAKKDYEEAKKRNDENAMEEAHRRAEEARKSGGTIGNVTLDEALQMRNAVQSEMNRTRDNMAGSTNTTINNDNGITQNNYFNQPVKSPSETAREVKKVGRELLFE